MRPPPRLRALLLLLAVSSPAAGKPVVVDPAVSLSLDFDVKDARTCILFPQALRDPEACQDFGEVKDVEKLGPGLQLLGITQKGDATLVLTIVRASQPGIGQLTAKQVDEVVKSWVNTRAKDFGAKTHMNLEEGRSYTLYRVNDGVPVVRWSYTSDLPEDHPKADRASSVVYLVPSKDQLDFISLSTKTSTLAQARAFGDQALATLAVPLTVNPRRFGADPTVLLVQALGRIAAILVGILVVSGSGVLVWRAARRGPRLPPAPPPAP